MTDVAWERPLPEPDPISSVYWAAAAEGRLLIQRCTTCGRHQHYPRALCARCAGEPEWLTASGIGTVYTFTVVRQYGMPPFKAMVPYVVAMIELPEGPRIMGNVTDCDPDSVSIGMPVEMYALVADAEVGVPMWRPLAEAAT
jgi:uncharacterized OB-fold protein